MKKYFFSLTFLSICLAVNAQNITNLTGKKTAVKNNNSNPVVSLTITNPLQKYTTNGPVERELGTLISENKLIPSDALFVVTSEHTSKLSGVHHIYFKQAVNGLEVTGTESSVHVRANGDIVSSNLNFVKNVQQFQTPSIASLNAEQAVQKIAQQMNYSMGPLNVIERSNAANQKTLFSRSGISGEEIPAKLMYYYNENIGLKLVWEVSIQELNSSNWYNFRLDATTGTIIDKDNWTVSCNILGDHSHHDHSDNSTRTVEENCVEGQVFTEIYTAPTFEESMVPTYQVYPLPLRSPYSGGRTNEVNPQDATASPLGWHNDGTTTYTRTQGNNVRCYDDDNNTNGPSNTNDYAEGGTSLVFQFPLEDTNGFGQPVYSATNQSEDAAVSHLFYISNVIHDIIYQYGMDEAGGAFQEDNFGNGGVGGDSVNAEAQDGSGTCNANFGTPGDGGNPRMQMYTCGNRDASFDNEVVIHEYGHGISNRLTGGPAAAGCLGNEEQMGEGWSDYYGVMLTMVASENGDDARGMGNWLNGGGLNGGGIRTHPYSTDFAENPHTYDDIKTEVAPHGVGSVWAAMLWEMTWEIMDKYEAASGNGFSSDFYTVTGDPNVDAGNIQAMAIVTEGLKLQACSPGFVDGRDAILQADNNIYGGANQCEIWAAFARRGLGFSASQGNSTSKSDGTEAFDLPPSFASFDNSIAEICVTEGTQNNLTGGLPTGGTYSGPGVTDNGNGTSYTFDPVAAGVGSHTITYNVVDGCTGNPTNVTETITVTSGDPLLICEDYTLQLDASGNGTLDWPDVVSNEIKNPYVVATEAIALETLTGAATTLALGDDAITGALPIGFDFELYGEKVSDFYVCSNGFIYFTPNTGMTDAQSRTAQTFPEPGIPNGIIALFMDDLDPSAGGTIRYQVFGTAPSRKLVVEYDDVPYWNTTDLNSGQIHIYEGTNVIETHVSVATDGGTKTLGVESIDGDAGTTHPATNNSGWTVASPGLVIRFTPQAPSFAQNCGNNVSFTLSETNFTCLDVGENQVTVTADDGNGGISTCTATVTVVPNPAQLTTYNGSWDNGLPNTTSVATFAGNYNTSAGNIEACSCIVDADATITVGAGEYIRSQGNITVDGTLQVDHQGSVVQVDPSATVLNNGTINVDVT
ncbi:M36 family metallopeptidase, partial [Marinirhabdus gelatinilytica]